MIHCEICQKQVHSILLHLRDDHPDVTLAHYSDRYPNAPLLSREAEEHIRRKKNSMQEPVTLQHAALAPVTKNFGGKPVKRPLFEVFGIEKSNPDVVNGRGAPIEVNTYSVNPKFSEFVPAVDADHIWNVEDLKNELMALEMNFPLYVWGHKGTGKTTDLEQLCARTGRPLVRVQHTINTEESHIIGQWTIQNGETKFELGPLPIAMMNGFTFLADEYDFALPSVLSVYQAVLEGKPLFIKEAPLEQRIVKPHENFRFVASGNTNGSGDEHGIYMGTSIQNAANYDRFAMCIKKTYQDAEAETKIVQKRAGTSPSDAQKLVKFAGLVRAEFEAKRIGDTLSTRSLVTIGLIGLMRGNMRKGVELSFANKLSPVDRKVVEQLAQRIWG